MLVWLWAADAVARPPWISIGPTPLTYSQLGHADLVCPLASCFHTGRVTSIAVDPTDAQHWIIGAAGGGVWETRDGGGTWTPRTDDQATLAIGAVAFAPSNPRIIYAGTGEANFFSFTYAGLGVLKSADGGGSWTLLAASSFARAAVGAIRVHPSNPDIVLAITASGHAGRDGGVVAGAPAFGVLRSVDGGVSWTRSLTGEATALEVDATNFNRQYAAIGYPFSSESSPSPGNGVYRSTDGGQSWTPINGPWMAMASTTGRIALAVAPSNPNVVYASIQRPFTAGQGILGLFRTDDAWAAVPTWTRVPTDATGPLGYCDNLCTYAHVISVDPTDTNTVFAGGQRVLWRCGNCASSPSWTDVSAPHPDHHALVWAGNRLIDGNDAGVWSTTDRGASWQQHNATLSIVQFWSAALHPTNPSFAFSGVQDNGVDKWTGTGVWVNFASMGAPPGESEVAVSSSRPDSDWMGGDIFGGVYRTRDGGQSFAEADAGIDKTGAAYVAPTRKCPRNDDVFVMGTNRPWRTNNFFSAPAPTWFANGPVLSTITAVAFADTDATCNTYALGTTSGQLQITVDGGDTWRDVDPAHTVPDRAVTALAFDPTNPSVLYVALSGFDEATPGQPGHLFKTVNALATAPAWANVSPPVNQPQNVILVDPNQPTTVYVGADAGVWVSGDGGAHWGHIGPELGLPNAPVYDLKYQSATRRVFAFTFGRGAFVLPPGLSAFAAVNQSTFAVGETVSITAGLTNPGLPGAVADIYVGLVKPGGVVEFFTGSGSAFGNVNDLSSFRPFAAGVALTTPFSVTVPGFFARQVTGSDGHGTYVFFVGAVTAGALSSALTSDKILDLATAAYSIP
jgi:photosystem II stability/assembly factor-like uncharacterized protein